MELRTFWATLAVLSVGVGSFWLARPRASPENGRPVEKAGHSRPKAGDQKVMSVVQMSRERGLERRRKLVSAYSEWAGDPSALAARKLALASLLAEPALGQKLEQVLEAVEGDPTPPEEDPLWGYLVEELSALWTSETFGRGRDLMLMENRPRARRALVASFIELSTSERARDFGDAIRYDLSADLVDLHSQVDPSQKGDVERALRALSGTDVADILNGRALAPGYQFTFARQLDEARAAAGTTSGPTDDKGDTPL